MRSALVLMMLMVSVCAQAAQAPTPDGVPDLSNKDAWKLYEKYISAWNTVAIDQRMKVATEILSEHVEYHTPRHELAAGRAQVIEDMAAFQQRFPGGHFEIGDVSAHHNVALLTWVIIQADGKEFARGHDQLTVDRDGKIAKITTFAPSAKAPD